MVPWIRLLATGGVEVVPARVTLLRLTTHISQVPLTKEQSAQSQQTGG